MAEFWTGHLESKTAKGPSAQPIAKKAALLN